MSDGPFRPSVCAWSASGPVFCGAVRVGENLVLKGLLSWDTVIPSLTCSYSPGGSDAGVQENWPDTDAVIRCIPMTKSVESREPRFCASARFLSRILDSSRKQN